MDQRSVDPAAIEAEVDQVRSLGIDALRRRWCAMFGAVPPKGTHQGHHRPDDSLPDPGGGVWAVSTRRPIKLWTDWLEARS